MNQKDILRDLHRLQSLVEGWSEGSVPAVERDLALEHLRRIYEALRFADAEPAQGETTEAEEEILPVAEEKEHVEEANEPATEANEPATEAAEPAAEVAVPAVEAVETPQAQGRAVAETQQEVAEVEAPEAPKEVAETPQASAEAAIETPQASAEPSDDEKEIFLLRHTNRRVVMSLYGDAPQPQMQPQQPHTESAENINTDNVAPQPSAPIAPAEPQQQPQQQPQQPTTVPSDEGRVLGEVINADEKRLCDTISRPKDIAASARVASVRSAIGINDRFLLIRDLFGGDETEYERAITAIDACANLDDCMVYIVEHYAWHSDTEGARLIVDLIERKFGK